jgi:phosphoglycolate phosphatase
MKLLLFDIDQTLLQSSKGHHEAFKVGFRETYGIEASLDGYDHSGMTDRAIILETLRREKLPDKLILAHMDACIRVMERAYAEIVKTDELVVLPGVRELLEALSVHPNLLMGLVTGNLETIAWNKMRKVGFAKYLKLGGFGNEDLVRAHLVQHAIQRASTQFGFTFSNNVYVFGDAPKDMEAGKAARATTIGVATGKYSKHDLKLAGADWTLNSLEDKEGVFSILDLT